MAAVSSRARWGDTLDDDDVGFLPPTEITGPDAKGVKTVVEYKKNDKGDTVKVTTRVKIVKMDKKQYEVTAERRKWRRFGGVNPATEKDTGITARAMEDIAFERVRPNKQTQEEKKAATIQQALQTANNQTIVGSLKDMLLQKRMDRQLRAARGELEVERPPGEDGMAPGGAAMPGPGEGKPGTWMGSRLRAAVAGEGDSMRRREENSVRVTNLSEDTREDDLRELFSPFGPISRIYVAYDRDTGENRGFAFVNFVHREDAQKAIDKLDGWGYDSLILRVEWAQPREQR